MKRKTFSSFIRKKRKEEEATLQLSKKRKNGEEDDFAVAAGEIRSDNISNYLSLLATAIY